MILYLVFSILFLPIQIMATPLSYEVWFISSPDTMSFNILDRIYQLNRNIAENTFKQHIACRPFGNLFFDPQIGLHSHDVGKIQKENTKINIIPNKNNHKYLSNLESHLITCDKGKFKNFDYYCGQAIPEPNKQRPNNSFEIWVDISSSFKVVDYNTNNSCYRKFFIYKLQGLLDKKKWPSVWLFDTSKKLMGSLDSLCQHYGTNDQNRLMDWIKKSKAKKLIIITDIYELDVKLRMFIESTGGVLFGHTLDNKLQAADIPKQITRILKNIP